MDAIAEQVGDRETSESVENQLAQLLDVVAAKMRTDIESMPSHELDENEATEVLAAVHAWAALASYATGRVYAPTSPWHHRLAGWGTKIAGILQKIANVLLTPLKAAAATLGASSYSVGIEFPWSGVQVSLTWP
ncbi:hypothetical protein AB0H49_07100 [Nocardia sp. NPDC050713]|uniref:hypothetical protein n=1 Tax=Nocardia sp. NPDC050713 TaxID=3154511 RepID=UPI0033F07973